MCCCFARRQVRLGVLQRSLLALRQVASGCPLGKISSSTVLVCLGLFFLYGHSPAVLPGGKWQGQAAGLPVCGRSADRASSRQEWSLTRVLKASGLSSRLTGQRDVEARGQTDGSAAAERQGVARGVVRAARQSSKNRARGVASAREGVPEGEDC